MARDETARDSDSDSEQSLLDERSYLRLAERAAATVAGTDVADESTEPTSDTLAVSGVRDGSE